MEQQTAASLAHAALLAEHTTVFTAHINVRLEMHDPARQHERAPGDELGHCDAFTEVCHVSICRLLKIGINTASIKRSMLSRVVVWWSYLGGGVFQKACPAARFRVEKPPART